MKQATQILTTTDVLAERPRKTGNAAPRSVGDIAVADRFATMTPTRLAPSEMTAELRDDNLALVANVRDAKDIVDLAKNNANRGVRDDWTIQTEQRAWLLPETVGNGKGG